MQTVDRGKYAILHPACRHIVITVSTIMTSDIMTPPSVADVGRGGGKFGLEVKRIPGNGGVAREADGIALAAGAAVAGKEHGAFAVSLNIQNMQIDILKNW